MCIKGFKVFNRQSLECLILYPILNPKADLKFWVISTIDDIYVVEEGEPDVLGMVPRITSVDVPKDLDEQVEKPLPMFQLPLGGQRKRKKRPEGVKDEDPPEPSALKRRIDSLAAQEAEGPGSASPLDMKKRKPRTLDLDEPEVSY